LGILSYTENANISIQSNFQRSTIISLRKTTKLKIVGKEIGYFTREYPISLIFNYQTLIKKFEELRSFFQFRKEQLMKNFYLLNFKIL